MYYKENIINVIITDLLLTIAIHYLMLGSLQAIWGRREERSVYQGRVNNDLSGGSLNQILEIIIKCTDEDDRGRIRSCDDEVTEIG